MDGVATELLYRATLRFSMLFWPKEMISISVVDLGEGSWGPGSPLIFRPNWGPMGRKKYFFRDRPPSLYGLNGWSPPFSEGLDQPLNLFYYLTSLSSPLGNERPNLPSAKLPPARITESDKVSQDFSVGISQRTSETHLLRDRASTAQQGRGWLD